MYFIGSVENINYVTCALLLNLGLTGALLGRDRFNHFVPLSQAVLYYEQWASQ